MQLTKYTDYGLRTLIYLAMLPEGKRSNIDEISSVYDISRNNVNKLVHQLGKEGIIETKRGKGGGFALKLRPEEINIGEVVLKLENTMEVVECNKPACLISPACRLKGVVYEATRAFIEAMKQYTLQDLLTGKQGELVQLFKLD